MRRIYLDANAYSPQVKEARDKLISCLDLFGNPSSFHADGRATRAILDEARDHLANAFGTNDKSIIFTSGASEANRLFVDLLLSYASSERKIKVLISPFEHPSLMKYLLTNAEKNKGLEVCFLSIDEAGIFLDPKKAADADVIICTSAHSETGIIPGLLDLIDQVRDNCLIMSDVTQSISRTLEKPHQRIDVLSCSSQKMGGYSGAGALVLRGNALKIFNKSPWVGGGQERGFRPGTENFLAIAAFGAAASVIERSRALNEDLKIIRDHLEALALKVFPKAEIVGLMAPRLKNTSAICFKGADGEALRIGCDLSGLSVGFGYACSGLAPEESFALKSLGIFGEDQKKTVRFSLSHINTFDDIEEATKRVASILRSSDFFYI